MALLVELSAVRGWMCGGGRVQGGHGVASGGRAVRGRASGGGGTPGERSLVARRLLEHARACSWASGGGGRQTAAYTRRWEKGPKGVTV